MADNPIQFGTSGWRGIIAENFTFPNVRLAAAGIAHHLLSKSARPRVIVGYDTRFLSEKFASTAAKILNSHGVETGTAGRPDPTPAIAHEIIEARLDGAVNITASHNPAEYNGLKFSGPDGAPALPEVTHDIERLAGEVLAGRRPLEGARVDTGLARPADPRPRYLDAIRAKIDLAVIGKAGLKIAYDPLWGTGRGYLDDLLREAGATLHVIHNYRDALFGGAGPDPSERNLAGLAALIKQEGAAIGLATDGDADRFGIVDADGAWIHPNYILAVLADYLIEVRKIPGGLGRSVATTQLIDAVAAYHHVPLYQTPVGFKYIGELIEQDKIALGGEESAGLSIRGHVPEKDGILACLLVAEMVAVRRASLAEQLRELFKRVGREFWPLRTNLHLTESVKLRTVARLKADFSTFLGRRVKS